MGATWAMASRARFSGARKSETVLGTVEGKLVRAASASARRLVTGSDKNTGSCKQAATGTLIACNPRYL